MVSKLPSVVLSDEPGPQNPFPFGRELSADELVDRETELALIRRTMTNRQCLFLIGPRRFGKTSLLHAAETTSHGVVLRHDAERYETTDLLAQAILASATRRLAGTLERAGDLLKRFASALKPQLALDPETGEISLSLTTPQGQQAALPRLTDVLDIVNRMAADSGKEVTVVIDEFQAIIKQHGLLAERQIRAVVQTHRAVSYIFAGSETRLLTEMTSDESRPFYKIGTTMFLGEVPPDEFARFLSDGFVRFGFVAGGDAIARILAVAEHVPFSVQQLAHECWESLRVSADKVLTPTRVDEATAQITARYDAVYSKEWTNLTIQQKRAIKAVAFQNGAALLSAAVLKRYDLPAATMQSALARLVGDGLIREDRRGGEIRYRLLDPFFGAWLRSAQRDLPLIAEPLAP